MVINLACLIGFAISVVGKEQERLLQSGVAFVTACMSMRVQIAHTTRLKLPSIDGSEKKRRRGNISHWNRTVIFLTFLANLFRRSSGDRLIVNMEEARSTWPVSAVVIILLVNDVYV